MTEEAYCDTCGEPTGLTRQDLERMEAARPAPDDPKVRWQAYAVCGACLDREKEEAR